MKTCSKNKNIMINFLTKILLDTGYFTTIKNRIYLQALKLYTWKQWNNHLNEGIKETDWERFRLKGIQRDFKY